MKYGLRTSIFIGAMATLLSCSVNDAKQKVDSVYERMSDEQRAAQLGSIYLSKFFTPEGTLDTAKCRELIPYGAGHFSQFAMDMGKTADEQRDMVAAMQAWLMENTGIPALFHEEALVGVNSKDATVYPQQIGLACSFDPILAEQKTIQTATALRSMGGRLALSPMVDVVRNPSFNRLEESYGEDAYLSAAMGVAFVKGLQHGDRLKQEGIPACTKHFLGYGGGGDAGKKELMEEILLPHEAIIRTEGSRVVMTGYHAVDGVKCVANSNLQKDILRSYLGYDGLLVSDYESIKQIDENFTPLQRCVAAFNAGNDVDFPHGDSYGTILEALDKGLVSREDFEAAVKRVLALKEAVGLLEKNPDLYQTGHIEFDTPQERQTAYKLATESVVLLENRPLKDGVPALPLRKGQNIFLTGPNANSMWAMLGDYSFQAMHLFWHSKIESELHPKIVFLKEGMERALPQGSTLSYSRGCDWTEEVETVYEKGGDPRAQYMRSIQNRKIDSGEKADWDEALTMAMQSDVIVAAMGENALLCGENRDRTHLRLPGRQEEYVNALIATGKPVILVIFGGRAQVIAGLQERCAAVIQAWYPGEEGGNALADILYGNVSPSGKLSVSYPSLELHEPLCYNNSTELDPRVAWPFGFGRSYASFEYSDCSVPEKVSTAQQSFNVTVDVANVSDVPADEIVQFYLSPLEENSGLKPIQLKGFARVSLAPGEKKKLGVKMFTDQLAYFSEGKWVVDPGRYIIKVGASSQDVRCEKQITLEGGRRSMALRTNYISEIL